MESAKTWKLALVAGSALLLSACQGGEAKKPVTNDAKPEHKEVNQEVNSKGSAISEENKESYAIGLGMGQGMKANLKSLDGTGIDVDIKVLAAAFADGILDQAKMEKAEQDKVMAGFQEKMKKSMQEKQKKAKAEATEKAKANIAAGEAYLKENGAKEGVVTLKSGLQYKVLKAGTGKQPKATDRVKVHYSGTLIDGTKFDSSYDRKVPATFGVTQVIPGWTEALKLMKEGDKWQLVIPSALAYGPNGRPGTIPGNSVLLFDVELLEVLPTEPVKVKAADK